MRASLPVVLLLLLSLAATAGCGLKDDLYLPPESAPATPTDDAEDAEDHAEDSRT